MGRILAVDPGSKNLGIALSDPSGTIANPLQVIKHVSRSANAAAIAALAEEHEAKRIIVGQSLDPDGQPTYKFCCGTNPTAQLLPARPKSPWEHRAANAGGTSTI